MAEKRRTRDVRTSQPHGYYKGWDIGLHDDPTADGGVSYHSEEVPNCVMQNTYTPHLNRGK